MPTTILIQENVSTMLSRSLPKSLLSSTVSARMVALYLSFVGHLLELLTETDITKNV